MCIRILGCTRIVSNNLTNERRCMKNSVLDWHLFIKILWVEKSQEIVTTGKPTTSFNGAIAGIIGIVLAHIIADFIAAMLDPNLKSAAYGIVLGGFLPLLAVPFLEKYVTKSQYHNVVGDHEDLKKDLKSKHK